jgi:cytosine/creatinine deaminase
VRGGWGRVFGRSTGRARLEWGIAAEDGFMSGHPAPRTLPRGCGGLAARLARHGRFPGVIDHHALLEIALAEARAGMEEGGIPIGGALFDSSGALLGRGHNQRVQRDDPSAHGETEAFRNAGRRRSYRDTIMATTLAPCWYCSGLIRQFGIGTVVVGESRTFLGGIEWLRECGVDVVDLDSQECADLLGTFIARHPEIWNEDIGE